jgi:hypothetical protein
MEESISWKHYFKNLWYYTTSKGWKTIILAPWLIFISLPIAPWVAITTPWWIMGFLVSCFIPLIVYPQKEFEQEVYNKSLKSYIIKNNTV